MKKLQFLVLLCSACMLCMISVAQTKKSGTPKKAAVPAKKAMPSSNKVMMTSALDSFSYAVGLSIASFYKEQGVEKINTRLVMQAINDVNAGKPQMDEAATNNCIVGFMEVARSEKAAGNLKAGEAFLAENKTKPGVVTLPSGLQYQILTEGTGAKPTLTDKVKVNYEGRLLDGTVFDGSSQHGGPIELTVNGVIPGWTEALQLMPTGSKWKLFIPSDLAYGNNQAGPLIKPGSTLIFDIELVEIVK